MGYVAGVDLGGTNVKIGIVNEEGKVLKNKSIKTLSEEGMERCFTRIWETVKELLGELAVSPEELKGIGIGIPGPVINQRGIGFFANFPWEADEDVAGVMEKISGKPARLENDANVWALAEARYGAAKEAKSSVAITIGTGIGAGICLDGKILGGATGAGGELGHMKLERDGKLCGCGQKGCFEAYASATGLLREAKSRLAVNKNNLLYKMKGNDLDSLEAKDIFDAARAGDAFSLDLVEYEAEYLAYGIGSILNVINPEMVVLGGGVALAGDILLDKVKEKIKKYALPVAYEKVKLSTAKLGNEAGIIGAAALIS